MPGTASSDLVAVLDTCVLFPASLRDTLLRLAETPRQYIPKWSSRILEELTRNLESHRRLTPEKTAYLIAQMERHFPEAEVTEYEKLIDVMTNDPKDRHVAAAAVQTGAQIIVTFNLKDFPAASLSDWGIEAKHPDEFLVYILGNHQTSVVSKIRDQATAIGRTLPELLRTLRTGVPRFAAEVASGLGLDISGPANSSTPPRNV